MPLSQTPAGGTAQFLVTADSAAVKADRTWWLNTVPAYAKSLAGKWAKADDTMGFPVGALRGLVGNLRPSDSFNIIPFSGGHSLLAPRSLPATRENIEAAQRFIAGQRGSGSTELLAALRRRFVMLDAAAGQPEKTVEFAHPFRVAAGQVVVYRDEVRPFAGQCIQVERQRGDEGLAFAGHHLRDIAAMKYDAAQDLDVEVPRAALAQRRQGHLGPQRPAQAGRVLAPVAVRAGLPEGHG